MNLRTFTYLLLLLTTAACEGGGGVEDFKVKEEQGVLRNLPTSDREYLLEPLEAAFDDLREVIENDPALFDSERSIDSNGIKTVGKFRLNGSDTVMMDLRRHYDNKREKFLAFRDDSGALLLIEAHLVWTTEGGDPLDRRSFKFYFDEGEILLSAYGKTAFNGAALPVDWVTIMPTPEELAYIRSQARF